jgi:hypothetical protein
VTCFLSGFGVPVGFAFLFGALGRSGKVAHVSLHLFSFGDSGNHIEGFMHARQALYL